MVWKIVPITRKLERNPMKLSVVILAQNSATVIEDCIKSAEFADEVLVLDGGSEDNTIEISKKLNARVEHSRFSNFSDQKQKSVDLAKNEWVFSLDSDERITPELKEEIEKVLINHDANGYLIPRLNYFFGKPIKRCGLYPDKNLRLFNKKFSTISESKVHEKVIIDGPVKSLKNHMIHLAYHDIDEFIQKQNRYSSIGKKKNYLKAIVNPVFTFFRIFIFQRGFLEGWRGYIIARLYSQYTFWKYIK